MSYQWYKSVEACYRTIKSGKYRKATPGDGVLSFTLNVLEQE